MSVQLGKDIAAARHKAKLSGEQLAKRVGVSAGWVRQLETGRMKKPNPQKLAAVANELGLSVHTALAMTDQLGADLTPEPASDVNTLAAILERQVAINELLVARVDALEAIVMRLAAAPQGAPTEDAAVIEAMRAVGDERLDDIQSRARERGRSASTGR